MMDTAYRKSRIRVVYFDLGKVLLRFDHNEIVERLLSRVEPGRRRPAKLFTFLFNMQDGLCNLYDEGNISSRAFFEEIDRRFEIRAVYDEFVELWNGIFTENADVSELMRQVRRKRPVYLLSNVNELHWEYVREKFPVLSEMDGWVLSYQVRAKKPKAEIFSAALAAAGAGPGEAAFIDDMEENTAAAGSHGMLGITFTGAGRLKEELNRLGLLR
jgi:HAD superfamily hydrolase (TIGR01509 family)